MTATSVAFHPDDPYTVSLLDAANATGYDKDYLRKLAKAGRLHGVQKKNRAWYFRPEDVAALVAPKETAIEAEQDRLLAELIKMAPRFTPERKARIAAAFANHGEEA
ncbi:helix-turn-helix domain-containing protein [Cutibacterium granulosum]|uniref:helix-turn-helix domain-containing protein n=1 Tax=Cutibacterium granulosum TaxID=33011 RepID=UPI0027B91663|nr:helix-turn-helix domain-containing protein [Cutibacterium granulosum]